MALFGCLLLHSIFPRVSSYFRDLLEVCNHHATMVNVLHMQALSNMNDDRGIIKVSKD
jgi:hypothetical protein